MSPTTNKTPTEFKATLSSSTVTTQPKGLINENKDNNNKENSILRRPNGDTISSPVQDMDRDRDARAYEHERQRVKHAGELAKRRARKTTIGGTAGGRPAGARAAHAGRQTKSLKGGKAGLEMDDGYAVTSKGRDTIREGLGAGLMTKVSLPPSEDGRTDSSSGVKVNLSEIMMLSQKKPRKSSADDFELIPHIRSVIALDDAIVHDMDLDEPWEHIYDDVNNGASDGVNTFGRLTYARVAGTGCQ